MDMNDFNNQKPIIYNDEDDFFGRKTFAYVTDAGILSAIESLLKGLPDTLRKTMSAGEVSDLILSMITDLREKAERDKQ